MEKIKSILSPGKHVEDEIMYGSGGGGQHEHTGREGQGSTGVYYGGTGSGTGGSQSQIYNRERDSIPSQPSTAQEYGKTEDDYLQAEKEREAKAKVAREHAARENEAAYGHGGDKAARGNGHRKQRSGEHKESRNPYTQQAVDPRLGGAEEPKVAGNAQPQTYAPVSSPTQTVKAPQGYEREDVAGRGGQGAAAAGLGAAGVAGAAGAAGATGTSRGAAPQKTDSPHGEVVGKTVSGNHLVERTASGQYRTRLASMIDPNSGEGVSTPESAYEHTPGGGGAYTADKFHEREPRYTSVTMPDGNKYTDPEAKEDSGLPSGVGYKAPAGSGYGEGVGRGGPSAYEQGGYGGQGQPQVATTKSEAAHAVSGDQAGHKGAGVVGAGVVGAGAAGAGYEGTKHHNADKAARKSASKAGQPSGAKYGDVDVPPGNDYGRGVKDPRYGLPMAAAGISAEEAAELRRNEANVAQRSIQNEAYGSGPTTAQQDYAVRPPGTSQAYPTQPTAANQAYAQPTQAEQQAARSSKEEKPSRRSSILGFLHLGKDKDKKRHSKDEKRLSKDDQKRLSDPPRQPYADRTGQAPLGSVAGAGYGGQQASVPGSTAGHGATDLAYRDRMPSTADAPAFTGGLVAPNGAPLKGPSSAGNADSSSWAKSTEREVMDRGGMAQGTQGGGAAKQAAYGGAGGGAANQAAYGGGATNQPAYSGGATNQPAYGTGIDESYPNEPTAGAAGTGATQGTAQKSGSQKVATTGGAIAAGAAAGGLAAGGARGSQANEGVASDYNMQHAQDRGAPADAHYDQVSPRSSAAANKKAQAANHTSNGSKEAKTTHKSHSQKEKNNTAYAGSDAQTRDAAYDDQVAPGGYGSNVPTSANGAQPGGAAYGGKETLASNDAYGGNAAPSGNAAYGGNAAQSGDPGHGNSSGGGEVAQNPAEAAFANEDYVGNGNGVSRHGTAKVTERAGHHVLHKDPPASHPAAAVVGVE